MFSVFCWIKVQKYYFSTI